MRQGCAVVGVPGQTKRQKSTRILNDRATNDTQLFDECYYATLAGDFAG
jgi:hypothetical protein